ncbi:hypothetical protein AMECASPLE_038089 [Ameca splendens]|uniref:Uncharacterized protein n=1 Tax=Ameca splendens TaxID=208324 RepID=A0ABV1AFZ5_9TELE
MQSVLFNLFLMFLIFLISIHQLFYLKLFKLFNLFTLKLPLCEKPNLSSQIKAFLTQSQRALNPSTQRDFFNLSWSNRCDAKPGLTPRNQPSVDSLEFLFLNLIITVSPFKYLNCLPSPASSGSRGPIPGHFEASQSLGEALTNPSLNTPVLVRTEFGLPNPELIYFNTVTI